MDCNLQRFSYDNAKILDIEFITNEKLEHLSRLEKSDICLSITFLLIIILQYSLPITYELAYTRVLIA